MYRKIKTQKEELTGKTESLTYVSDYQEHVYDEYGDLVEIHSEGDFIPASDVYSAIGKAELL